MINTLILYLCALEYFSWIKDVFQISLVLGLLQPQNYPPQPNSTEQLNSNKLEIKVQKLHNSYLGIIFSRDIINIFSLKR